MIHVFGAARGLCNLPGKACTECGRLCGCCAGVQDCCFTAGRALSSFTEKPLSSFVIISVPMSICEIMFCVDALREPELEGCVLVPHEGRLVGVQSWLYLQIAFAFVNLVFAPYFQHKVWQQICRTSGVGMLPGPGPLWVPRDQVQESFKAVFLHDVGVCFYFFVLVCSFGWSTTMHGWLSASSKFYCDPEHQVSWAAWLGASFFWVAFLYSMTWYCCGCCASSVELDQPIGAYGPHGAAMAPYGPPHGPPGAPYGGPHYGPPGAPYGGPHYGPPGAPTAHFGPPTAPYGPPGGSPSEPYGGNYAHGPTTTHNYNQQGGAPSDYGGNYAHGPTTTHNHNQQGNAPSYNASGRDVRGGSVPRKLEFF